VISARTLFNPKKIKNFNKWTLSIKPAGQGRLWNGLENGRHLAMVPSDMIYYYDNLVDALVST